MSLRLAPEYCKGLHQQGVQGTLADRGNSSWTRQVIGDISVGLRGWRGWLTHSGQWAGTGPRTRCAGFWGRGGVFKRSSVREPA
jgi:hypothetical protein